MPYRLAPEHATTLALARQRLRDGDEWLLDLDPLLTEAVEHPAAFAYDELLVRRVRRILGLEP